MNRPDGEIIEMRAVHPAGDLACDTTIATAEALAGLGDDLRRHIRRPIRSLPDGVEVRFVREGWAVARRYVELESQCCSFLSLRLEEAGDDVVLSITGRPEARAWIEQIFA
jgi:hypothetical protein